MCSNLGPDFTQYSIKNLLRKSSKLGDDYADSYDVYADVDVYDADAWNFMFCVILQS